jgi:nucleotide-binding universal stress UspA family protein
MLQITRILVPTDFSAHSRQALKYACAIAERFSSELHLLNVVQPLALSTPYVGALPDELMYPVPAARQELDKLEAPGLEQAASVERAVRTGTPFVEIVRYAREKNIDLIVMGTHGHGGLVHALLGSVAEKVVRKAGCPVLTVRPEGHQFVMP